MWSKFRVYNNQIKYETDNATLVKMPHNGEYDGFCFCVSNKLVTDYGSMKAISFNEDFVFTLKKYRNKREVESIELPGDIVAQEFNGYVECETIYTPKHIEPEGAVADESLIDY